MSTTWINRGHLYAPHVTPVILDFNFMVSASDTAGLGIINGSLKGQGVQNVFMHTTATAGKGPNGFLNPNPAVGYAVIQLADNFSRLYCANVTGAYALSGTSLAVDATALTVGAPYTITAVGTSTAADWLALGLPPGVVPAVGASFIAKVTGSGSGSGTVQAPLGTGVVTDFSIVGNPSADLSPIPVGGSPNVGGWLILQFLAPTSSSVTTQIPTAPPSGCMVEVELYLSQSSVFIAGE